METHIMDTWIRHPRHLQIAVAVLVDNGGRLALDGEALVEHPGVNVTRKRFGHEAIKIGKCGYV
jgi:hypothetical protein